MRARILGAVKLGHPPREQLVGDGQVVDIPISEMRPASDVPPREQGVRPALRLRKDRRPLTSIEGRPPGVAPAVMGTMRSALAPLTTWSWCDEEDAWLIEYTAGGPSDCDLLIPDPAFARARHDRRAAFERWRNADIQETEFGGGDE